MEKDLKNVTLLGNQNTKYKFDYDPTILERFRKHFEDSVEDEQIVNLDCFEFASRCLTGDTLIDVARDETKYPNGIPIKDLVGTEGYVFGVNPDTGEPVAKKYHDVRLTQKLANVVKITLDAYTTSGGIRRHETTYLRCTPDHMILTRPHWHTYEWVQAKDLKPGMHLVYSRRSQDSIREKSTHRTLAASMFGESAIEGMSVHHIDGNHFNNSPDNIELKTPSQHSSDHRHAEYGYENSLDPEYLANLYNSGWNIAMIADKYNCDSGTIRDRLEGLVDFRPQGESLRIKHNLKYEHRDIEICELYQRGYTSYEIGNYVGLHSTRVLDILRENGIKIRGANDLRSWRKDNPLPSLNHRVVSVEYEGLEDVYNMEVDDIENFFANDVIVHNCPKTGQPDFATIHISYIPNEYMVESKSLKLYLFSFQQHGDFHETCIHMIMNDLVKLLEPKYLEVFGDFNSRGGISILPHSIYADEDHKELKKARQVAMIQEMMNHKPRTGA